MYWKPLLPCAAAVLSICPPVAAQTVPVLSGKYAATYNVICQAGSTSYPSGATINEILVADFDYDAKTVKLTGTLVSGALTATNAKLTQSRVDTSYAYSNTATTITIGTDTFNALYGPLILGTPQWTMFGGIGGDGCSASAVAIRQSPLSVTLPAR